MKAILSGQAGIAVLSEGGRYWSVSVEEPDLRKSCAPEEIPFIFAGAEDVSCVDASESEVLTRLNVAWEMDRALQMTLVLLDLDEDQETREMAAECLEEFLQNADVFDFVANRLYESPLTDQADVKNAIEIATKLEFEFAASLLGDLQQQQSAIQHVAHAFAGLDDQFFSTERFQSRPQARRWFSDRGVFRKLAKGRGPSIGNEVMRLLLNPEIASIPKAKALILEWTSPLKSPPIEMDYSTIESEESEGKSHARSTKRSSKRTSRSAHESKELVDRQLDEILALIEKGDDARALQWAADVFQRQIAAGDEAYGVKSMSKLAIQMKQRGRPDLQLHFASMAAASKFADAQSLCQLADALMQSGEPIRALRQYDETIARFDNEVVAQCGRAEVLRELGRYEDALEQYGQTIARFSNEEVARNGRAEVLRELGRYDEALQQYEQTISRFGSDVVAQCGRAEVLRELGRYEDALEQYQQSIAQFDTSVVARNGRAEVLRELGRYEDALEQYQQSIAQFDTSVVARNGRAEVLRELGRYEVALDQYEQTIARFGNNVVARSGRAGTSRTWSL
ncbi:MAG: tetratricopeptide repeat protein [Pirellulales bacterium]